MFYFNGMIPLFGADGAPLIESEDICFCVRPELTSDGLSLLHLPKKNLTELCT